MRSLQGQQGLTLIELLIALAITTVIMGTLLGVIYSVMRVSGKGNDEIEALRSIRSVAYSISNDAQMAQSANLTGGPGSDNVTLAWNDRFGDPHTINFALYGTQLLRHYDGVRTIVADDVGSIEFSVSDDILIYTITSDPDGMWDVSRSFTGRVTMRAVP